MSSRPRGKIGGRKRIGRSPAPLDRSYLSFPALHNSRRYGHQDFTSSHSNSNSTVLQRLRPRHTDRPSGSSPSAGPHLPPTPRQDPSTHHLLRTTRRQLSMPPPFAYGSRAPAQPTMEWLSIFPRSSDTTKEFCPFPTSPLPDNRKRKVSPWSSSEAAIVAEERADSLRALRSDALVRLRRASAGTIDAFAKPGNAPVTSHAPCPSTSQVDRAPQTPAINQPPTRDIAQLWAENEILRAQLQASKAEVRTYQEKIRDLTSRAVNAEADAEHAGLLNQKSLRAAKAANEQSKTARSEAEEAEGHVRNLEHELADAQIDAQDAEQRAERAEERAADAERRLAVAGERCSAAQELVAACRAEHGGKKEPADGDG